MKKYILYLAAVFLLSANARVSAEEWNIAKSTHFIVYYKNAPEDFISQLIDKSEDYYNGIADNLGFRRYNFWLWDNRAKIYIHADANSYQALTGQPAWSSGCAQVKEKIIHTFPYAKGFFDRILPHEIGHIIFREFVGFDNRALPLWLDEGVASYQENLPRKPVIKKIIREAVEEKKFLDLESLSRFNPHSTADNELVNLFYVEAVSLVDYLVSDFGTDKFVHFCQALRDKKNLEESLASTYSFRNSAELDESWQRYLRNE